MPASGFLNLMRATWLTLAGMMLLSRFAFQAAGPVRMRAFLDLWKQSRTHRVWGLAAFGLGLVLLGAGLENLEFLGWLDLLLGGLLIVVLLGDGLLNLLPRTFSNFKESLQDAWVRRHQGTDREGDAALFATVNLGLGLASIAMEALVLLYRPMDPRLIALCLVLAAVLTTALIGACLIEGRKARP